MITQNFENSQKSVFCHTFRAEMGIKGWLARVAPKSA
jgi:hypothetical protein